MAWRRSQDGHFCFLGDTTFAAAALILATCTSDGNPELVVQSLPGFAPQNGQRTDSGLTGSISGVGSSSADILRRLRLARRHKQPSKWGIAMTLVSCFPQFVVLLVGEFECELSRLALH